MIKVFRLLSRCAVASLMLLLAACAGQQAYQQGNALINQGKLDEGLSKLETAVRLEPQNSEYRIALASQRLLILNQLIYSGDAARREGRFDDAEKAYRQALILDADHSRAVQGINALVLERRQQQAVVEVEEQLRQGGPNYLENALEKLRVILLENPNQKSALNLKARIEAGAYKKSQQKSELAAAYQQPISLVFREAPLRSVFDVIAQVSGLNFFFDRDLRPDLRVTITAKNMPLAEALRLILATNQLEQKIINRNSVLIYPSTAQKIKDYQTLTVRTFYLTNADVKAVATTLKTIVRIKDIVVDERLGLIVVRDTPEAVHMAERLIALQDLNDPEVMLEVEIMEIKRSRLLALGIQWPGQLNLSPLRSDGQPVTLDDIKNINSSSLRAVIGDVVINLRKENQNSNLLANPRIRVRNKEKAKILIGERVPVITTTSTATGFASESVNYIDVGLKLGVEPMIYLDEEVAIKINLEVSSILKQVTTTTGSLVYNIGTREASTVLRLKDGETQILAGLISDEDRSSANKVPGLGELPVLDRLFGSKQDNADRSEILLSITPHIVRSLRTPDLFTAEFESGTESRMGVAFSPPTMQLSTTLTTPSAPDASAPQSGTMNTPTMPNASPPALGIIPRR